MFTSWQRRWPSTHQPAAESGKVGLAQRHETNILHKQRSGVHRPNTAVCVKSSKIRDERYESKKYARQKRKQRGEIKNFLPLVEWFMACGNVGPPAYWLVCFSCVVLAISLGGLSLHGALCPMSKMQPTCCFQCQNSAVTNVKTARLATFKGMWKMELIRSLIISLYFTSIFPKWSIFYLCFFTKGAKKKYPTSFYSLVKNCNNDCFFFLWHLKTIHEA